MAAMKLKSFTVVGTYLFPIDMLRYDASWPATEGDALNISRTFDSFSLRSKEKEVYKIRLVTNNPFSPTIGRWNSFGWSVQEER